MAIFFWIFISLVVMNVLLLVFSNSLRSTSNFTAFKQNASENRQRVYNFKAVESELKKVG